MPSDSAAPHGGADRSYLDTALRAISVTGSLRSSSQQSTPSRSEPVAEMVANNSQARIKNEPDPHYGSGSFFVRPAWAFAWRCKSSRGEGGLTLSQWQLRHREVGWEGSRRRSSAPRNTNRI